MIFLIAGIFEQLEPSMSSAAIYFCKCFEQKLDFIASNNLAVSKVVAAGDLGTISFCFSGI